jgi:putative phosphoesterase
VKIGLISDTHDNLGNLRAAFTILQAEGVTRILHCGDVCKPDTARALSRLFTGDEGRPDQNGYDIWIAQGNMDRHLELDRAIHEAFGPGRLAWLHRLTLNGCPVAMLHGDNGEVLRGLIAAGKYAYVFHGHTHRRRDQTIGRTRVINPGALGGLRRQNRSLCILDLETADARFVEV